MGLIKALVTPIRRVAHFPLFQFAITVAVILWLQAADSKSISGEIFNGLDWLVDFSVRQCAAIFEVKSFTRSWLTVGFMIGYVYLAGLVILLITNLVIGAAVELGARVNAFGLRNAIARERGIAAYRAWLPLERIRPGHIPQEKWEQMFAWPPDDKPPYPSLLYRALRGVLSYVVLILVIATLLQVFTPFPALNWLESLAAMLIPGR
ncbi:MAG TPA: hypothetical protein VH678_05210 [Xanthobacteraceae bacterium]|jgi:hypothetical protein